jgi:hypothetical protein
MSKPIRSFKYCYVCKDTKEQIEADGRYFYGNGRCNKCGHEAIKKYRSTESGAKAFKETVGKYYKNNKEEILKKQSVELRELKQAAVDAYGGECVCCKERRIEFLVIDHINGRGNEHRRQIGRNNMYRWLKINEYPEGFRTLCYNCNIALKTLGRCPHNNGITKGNPEEAPYISKEEFNECTETTID